MSICRMIAVAAAAALMSAGAAGAAEVTVPMKLLSADGKDHPVGSIRLRDSKNGLLIRFRLSNLIPAGLHGLHIHQNPSCAAGMKDGKMVAGLAAGGHYDPDKTGKHEGPSGRGHRGDLPLLFVEIHEDEGAVRARHTVVAPRLKVADVLGRSIMIHEYGDNYRDTPAPLGGGGARLACGVIPAKAQ